MPRRKNKKIPNGDLQLLRNNKAAVKQGQNRKPKSDRQIELERQLETYTASKCAVDWLKLAANPFVPTHKACLPIAPSFPSQKLTVSCRGSGAIGTAGVGFVMVEPKASIANDNATPTVFYSDATFTGTAASGGAGVGVVSLQSNSPYTVAQFAQDATALQYRLVCGGLRMRYTGTQLNMGGRVVAYREPKDNTVNGLGISDILLDQTARTASFDRKWRVAAWTPMGLSANSVESDYEFSYTPGAGYHCLLGIASGTAGESFEFEFYGHFEVIGDAASLHYTPSHADPQNAGIFMAEVASADVRARNSVDFNPRAVVTRAIRALGQKTEETLYAYANKAVDSIASSALSFLV